MYYMWMKCGLCYIYTSYNIDRFFLNSTYVYIWYIILIINNSFRITLTSFLGIDVLYFWLVLCDSKSIDRHTKRFELIKCCMPQAHATFIFQTAEQVIPLSRLKMWSDHIVVIIIHLYRFFHVTITFVLSELHAWCPSTYLPTSHRYMIVVIIFV